MIGQEALWISVPPALIIAVGIGAGPLRMLLLVSPIMLTGAVTMAAVPVAVTNTVADFAIGVVAVAPTTLVELL
jgi:hypothetical protein